MTAINVRHVGIVTTDLKRSLNFYRKVLGFKIVKKMKETHPSLSDIMALKNTKVTTVKMKSKDNGMIELLSWHSPKSKKKVRVVFIAEGSSCRYNEEFNKDIINKKISQRTNFAKKALKILKVKDFVFYNLKCGSLNIYPLIKINQLIEEEISKFCPDTIITHNSDDCNNGDNSDDNRG